LLRDTELLLRDTESLLRDTELLLRDTELLLRDTELLLRDRHRIVTQGHRIVTQGHRIVTQGHRIMLLRDTELEYVRQHAEEWQRRQCFRSEQTWQQRKGSSSTSRSQRPVLPVSSSGRVSTDNPAVIDWLARSSSSSQVTSDTYSQRSVGTSDTTVSWHGPGASPLKSRVLYLPLSFGVPSPSEVSHAVGSAPLYSEEELTEGGQERGGDIRLFSSQAKKYWRGEWLGSRSRDRSVS
ncbi:unnamed protein product, partial [Staurois parvus]